ncbi:hypothetical protein [Spirillospora sp. CA-294931]|uniref:hypothetical protein n=1 Tax=Spirillospora sp. CA-294931 TaxID=3240042 RepID=UPI003D8BE2D7
MSHSSVTRSWLLGGPLSPIGWSVGFLEAPLDTVVEEIVRWRKSLGRSHRTTPDAGAFPGCLRSLEPLQTPWKRELLIEMGGWTVYLNNPIDGGDPPPVVGYLSEVLGCRGVLATHQPMTKVGHASTQFELLGPDGCLRALAAHAADGRWSWDAIGTPQPFEETALYGRRIIRERFTRPVLVDYLAALGIEVDNQGCYGGSALIVERSPWRSRTMSLPEAREYWELDGAR